LLRWVLRGWPAAPLPLALDVTYLRDRWVVVSLSLLYRGTALPVAWQVLPANQEGAWLPHLLGLVAQLAPAVPAGQCVLLLSDRGLWSPARWHLLRAVGWHPLMRVRGETTFAPAGGIRRAARQLVPGRGHAWVGQGVAFKRGKHQAGTLLVVWDESQAEPWLVLTDLAPQQVGVAWYGLRVWVELGFRALKRLGWQWQRTRRSDPERIARHWLVLAVATLWVLSTGTRCEDAVRAGIAPARLHRPPASPATSPPRRVSVFARGLVQLRWHLSHGGWWRQRWLTPDPLPRWEERLAVVYHAPT
jgi:hypothetical protein